MGSFSCPTCSTGDTRQDRQGVRTASQLEQKYNGVIEGLDLKVEGLDEQYAKLAMDANGIKLDVQGLVSGYSTLEANVNGLSLEVSGLSGNVSSLAFTVNGLTITDDQGTTRIKGSSIDTSTLRAKSITADKLALTGAIAFTDLSAGLQNDLSTTTDRVTAWSYSGSTYIDGNMIMADTVMATKLLGGTVGLLDSAQTTIGSISILNTSTGDGLAFTTNYGGVKFDVGGRFWVETQFGSFGMTSSGLVSKANCLPLSDNAYSLGGIASGSTFRWTQLYAATSTISTSDREQKKDISYDLTNYEALYDSLKPVSYKFKDGTSGRTHIGFISQDIEETLLENGMSGLDFAGFCKDENAEGGYDYALRYSEFIALNTMKIKKLEAEINALKNKVGVMA